jgi:hypothetical protein
MIRAICCLFGFLMASGASAVELQPPLLAMSSGQVQVAAGDIVGIDREANKIKFAVQESLRGGAKGEIELLVDHGPLETLANGQGYLVFFSDLTKGSKPRTLVRDPKQARVLSFEGVALALFRDDAARRELLLANPLELAAHSSYRDQVLTGLNSDDPQMADLWSGELSLRADRLSPYSPADIRRIRAFVESPDAPSAARARLLLLAHDRRPIFGDDWFAESASTVLATLPLETLQDAGYQQLAFAAMTVVGDFPDSVSPAVLRRWLVAPPVYGELAVALLRRQGEDVAAAMRRKLQRVHLDSATRAFLESELRRIDAAAN